MMTIFFLRNLFHHGIKHDIVDDISISIVK